MAWEDEFIHKPATPEEEAEFFWLIGYLITGIAVVFGMIKGINWLF